MTDISLRQGSTAGAIAGADMTAGANNIDQHAQRTEKMTTTAVASGGSATLIDRATGEPVVAG
ncbi:MAG: hypothetical protein ORN57_02915, partial [Alphaproteobacteria bacterium]|nr:hypothetical protein [Alphaproteobacteria bacterium]